MELVLKLMKSLLPDDIRMRLVQDTKEWLHQTLLETLEAIRHEAANKAKKLEATLEEQEERGQPVTITPATWGDPKLTAVTDSKIIKAL